MNRTYDIRNTKMYADEQGKLKSENNKLVITNVIIKAYKQYKLLLKSIDLCIYS
jgi:hypothetical protein